jgi:hypothetical protein
VSLLVALSEPGVHLAFKRLLTSYSYHNSKADTLNSAEVCYALFETSRGRQDAGVIHATEFAPAVAKLQRKTTPQVCFSIAVDKLHGHFTMNNVDEGLPPTGNLSASLRRLCTRKSHSIIESVCVSAVSTSTAVTAAKTPFEQIDGMFHMNSSLASSRKRLKCIRQIDTAWR